MIIFDSIVDLEIDKGFLSYKKPGYEDIYQKKGKE